MKKTLIFNRVDGDFEDSKKYLVFDKYGYCSLMRWEQFYKLFYSPEDKYFSVKLDDVRAVYDCDKLK